MNKLIKIFVSLFLGVIIAFGISGCETTDTPSGDLPEEETAGSFYTLQEAYDNGWLTQEDLMNIAYYNNGGRTDNEEIMSEDYQPAPQTPEVLSEKTELKIKSTAAKEYREDNIKDVVADGFTITRYYGTYGDCVAVMMTDNYTDHWDWEVVDCVAGVKLHYNNSNQIKIWRETEKVLAGSFYTLQEAYDNGWLTQEDLMSIAYYNNGGRTDNEEIMSEDYQPAPKTPEVLSESVAKSIKKAWAKRYNGDNTNQATDITEEMVNISEYYGTYKDCVAVIADRSDVYYADVYAPVPVEIGGVTFIFQLYRPEILVCKF